MDIEPCKTFAVVIGFIIVPIVNLWFIIYEHNRKHKG